MKLTFWGAARTVTGSMHQLDVAGQSYLLDCGMYQGRRQEAIERNTHFPFSPASLKALMLSHAHIDHSGNLPLLVKNGFHGPIYTSAATADLCHAMLLDSASVQEHNALFLNKQRARRKAIGVNPVFPEIQPLYTVADAERVLPLFQPVALHTPTEVGPSLRYQSFDAGHILGSTTMVLESQENSKPIRLAFSGDVGRPGLPIIRDPEPMPPADYLILESTYGDRLHQPITSVTAKLADIINRTCQRGGKIIVPAFAVGRTQQLVLVLHELINRGTIPSIRMFVDSPLAVNITEVFRKHAELFDEETNRFLTSGQDPFGFSRLSYVRDVTESKGLNDIPGPLLILSASGMCEAGRILHHLKNNIEDSRNTILITGYQAENTLGSKIAAKWPQVPIFGRMMQLHAEVAKIDELSGHADQHELLDWMKPITGGGSAGLKKVFLVHGEPAGQNALAAAIRERYKLEVIVPSSGESFELT